MASLSLRCGIMKVGDIVKIKDQGLSRWAAEKYLCRTGIIVSVTENKAYPAGDRPWNYRVMIDGHVTEFLPRYIEVLDDKQDS